MTERVMGRAGITTIGPEREVEGGGRGRASELWAGGTDASGGEKGPLVAVPSIPLELQGVKIELNGKDDLYIS